MNSENPILFSLSLTTQDPKKKVFLFHSFPPLRLPCTELQLISADAVTSTDMHSSIQMRTPHQEKAKNARAHMTVCHPSTLGS